MKRTFTKQKSFAEFQSTVNLVQKTVLIVSFLCRKIITTSFKKSKPKQAQKKKKKKIKQNKINKRYILLFITLKLADLVK